ncbi:ExeM/NucH family extracellular endonuclease [Schaalia suimastitidis]|uniref:ExeM/NucH family extracellular endonuclease n=1 Tax=Schaalia suimastitidis TaxID=121163 RepID=UPI0003FDBD15|nr:ExeM/NucH family extracellular endonuclease [Schaalia suimastitidis]
MFTFTARSAAVAIAAGLFMACALPAVAVPDDDQGADTAATDSVAVTEVPAESGADVAAGMERAPAAGAESGAEPAAIAEGGAEVAATADDAPAAGADNSTSAASALTPIRHIQALGQGDDSALVGTQVTVRGIVTGVYPRSENGLASTLDGMTIQTPGSGGVWDPSRSSSDGLFVYLGRAQVTMPTLGQCVEVKGVIAEFPSTTATTPAQTPSLTQLTTSALTVVEGCDPVSPTPIDTVPTPEQMEALESMLIAPQGTWTITDNYQANMYGTLSVTPGTEVLKQAADVVAPGEQARAYEAQNAARHINLDDGTNTNLSRAAATSVPFAYLANGAPARVGYHLTFTSPVILDTRHGAFVFQPTRMAAANPDRSPVSITGSRPSVPTVEGDITVATFNVLNYFTDLGQNEAGCKGYADRDGNYVTAKDCKVRGAWSLQAFNNQQTKIVQAITAINADVVALEEIENPVGAGVGTDRDGPLRALVHALNDHAGADVWAAVPSPTKIPANEDAIRVAFIYQPSSVTTVGESTILDDPAFTGLARQPLAQEFAPVVTDSQEGRNFVVIANHFKSKGSVPVGMEAGNTDTGDGQGNSNAIRVAQAQALATFAAQYADKPTLLVGDFNAYSKEDPLKVLTDAGWEHTSAGAHASYVYSGRSGSLDHVFANAVASSLVTNVASWALNAQESIAFEYSRANYNTHLLFEADNPYRSSDHNPEIVGLDVITNKVVPTPSPDPGTTEPTPVPPNKADSTGATTKASASTMRPTKKPTIAKTGVDHGITYLAVVCLMSGLVVVAMRRRHA